MAKPLASLSLDLDNKWSYLKVRGDDSWQDLPSYFDVVVPRLLAAFDAANIKATIFVVGQDAKLRKNQAALRSIVAAGHEIANHSFHHEPWLHLYSSQQVAEELELAEDAIREITNTKLTGFRGPGFSISDEVLQELTRRGYRYDATSFPTFLGPLARLFYFLRTSLDRQQREDRKKLFGKFRDGFQTLSSPPVGVCRRATDKNPCDNDAPPEIPNPRQLPDVPARIFTLAGHHLLPLSDAALPMAANRAFLSAPSARLFRW